MAATGLIPGRCAVIGGGLAGTAAAASLARRGWTVRVLDSAATPACGASGLPAGLLAPHYSADDNLLSRLSRAGVAATLREARALLAEGTDWQPTGLLHHRVQGKLALQQQGNAWIRNASDDEKSAAGVPGPALAWWQSHGAWIRPAALVQAWLAQPGIEWCGQRHVLRIDREEPGAQGGWVLRGSAGVLAQADLVVVAGAIASSALLGGRLHLTPVRGQVSLSSQRPASLPPFPVNGDGHFIPCVPLGTGMAWLSGATYGRGDTHLDERPQDHLANLARLQSLLPGIAPTLAPLFESGAVRGWVGVRCTSSDRRPLVGPVEPGLWVTTAMGSRGLTFAALCGELLAARLHGEPLPLDEALAAALAVERQLATG